jgi:hypothetical protein
MSTHMTNPTRALPDVLTRVRTKRLFQLRVKVPPLYIVGATPNLSAASGWSAAARSKASDSQEGW